MTSPTGLHSTVVTVLAIWAILLIPGVAVAWKGTRLYQRKNVIALTTLGVVIGPALGAISLSPLIYAVVSIPRDQIFEQSFWQREVAQGTLALRVASLLLVYQIGRVIARYVPDRIELMRSRRTRGLTEDDVADFTTSVTDAERVIWQRNNLMILAFLQFSFYLVGLGALWCCVAADVTTVFTALASWALLFIVDDSSIIVDYCRRFDSLPIRMHALKVALVDLLLLVTIPIALFPAKIWTIWTALSLAMLLLTLLIAVAAAKLYLWRERPATAE